MLEVVLPRTGNLVASFGDGKGLDSGAPNGQSAEKRGVGLPMREHYHVTIIDPIAFVTMLILGRVNKVPMLS